VGAEISSSSDGGAAADDGLIVYPKKLLALVWNLGFAALPWTLYFFLVVSPALEEDVERAASHGDDSKWLSFRHDDQLLRQWCLTIVFSFHSFVTVRGLMWVKPIGRRLQDAQHGRLGSSMMYFSLAVLYGPLLIFTAASVTFLVNEFNTNEQHENMHLTRTLNIFGGFSCLMTIMSCGAVLWHRSLATEARMQVVKVRRRRAPPDFITRIPTVPYDPDLFGQEDGRRYPGECCICLGEFEPEDEISVPFCGHAFHRECLGHWLRSHRTCALCRQDVTQVSEALAEEVGSSAEVAVPRARGCEEAAPGAAAAAHSGAVRV
jgi:hypothetical protein